MRLSLPVMLLSFSSIATVIAAPKPSIDDYLGKWDLEIANTGSSFRACCLVLEQEGDQLRGEMVWRWGSVWRFEGDKAVEFAPDGSLLLRNKNFGVSPLRLRRIGGFLEGSVKQRDGNVFYVSGPRAREVVDPSGTWNMTVRFASGREDYGTLIIENAGHQRYTGKATNSQGGSVSVQKIQLDGSRLAVDFLGNDGGNAEQLTLEGEVRGDRFEGKIALPDGSEEIAATGTRQRSWGPPVRLIAESGSSGWHRRDWSRDFKWTCDGAVLTNGNHDVDIVSDAEFQDFKLRLEYKVDKKGANSGVYLRGRYEVQIVGSSHLSDHSNGAVYSRLKPLSNPFTEPGEWQIFEATLIGRYLTVKLNGETVLENQRLEGITGGALNSREDTPGPLMLQGDHGKIYFRNIEVWPAL